MFAANLCALPVRIFENDAEGSFAGRLRERERFRKHARAAGRVEARKRRRRFSEHFLTAQQRVGVLNLHGPSAVQLGAQAKKIVIPRGAAITHFEPNHRKKHPRFFKRSIGLPRRTPWTTPP